MCYYVKDNHVTMIGSDIDYDLVLTEMKKNRLNKIHTIIAYDFQLNNIDNLIKIVEEFDVENVYIPSKFDFDSIEKQFISVKYFSNNIIIDNLQFNSIEYKDQIIGVTLRVSDIGTILIPEIKPTKLEAKYLIENYANVDFIYINSDNINIKTEELLDVYVISNEMSSTADIELEIAERYVLNTKTAGVNV